jgi:hypothetical protein
MYEVCPDCNGNLFPHNHTDINHKMSTVEQLEAENTTLKSLIERLVEAGEVLDVMHDDSQFVDDVAKSRELWRALVSEWQAMKGGKEGYWYARGNLLDYIASLEAQLAERGALHPALEAFVKNVQDLICQIITACTYQDEPTAAAGKYSLPIDCFRSMEALSLASHNISDGACVLATENRTTKESVE